MGADASARREDAAVPDVTDGQAVDAADVPAVLETPPIAEAPVDPRVSPWSVLMPLAWPAINEWTPRMEREYGEFVAGIGRAVAARRCRRLAECLRLPEANVTYDARYDAGLRTVGDCADLPYLLRAYFAFKRRLPFAFVSRVRGHGRRDARYMSDVRPVRWHDWRDHHTPAGLFSVMGDLVHSGMYRLAPEIETGDFYPAAIRRGSVRPGTMFYDPNGHVLVVADVRDDGAVFMIDGHPDGSVTYRRFGAAIVLGGRSQGGGFQNFRPVRVVAQQLVRASNASIPDFDGDRQWDRTQWIAPTGNGDYHAWVRASLTAAGATRDPVREFREQIDGLCRDFADRVTAVQFALDAGIQRRAHPSAFPWNIYGAMGDWELYSTPSRDARLRASLREAYQTAQAIPVDGPLRVSFRDVYMERTRQPDCQFAYINSAGASVTMTFAQVLERIYAMSFDPYHCPELRWGAAEGSPELATCPDDANKRWWYRSETRLRRAIDRDYATRTTFDGGPEVPAPLDVRAVLGVEARMSAIRSGLLLRGST